MTSKKTYLKNIGQVPGTVVYTWDKMTVDSQVWMVVYDEANYQEIEVEDFQQCASLDPHQTTRIDFIGLDQTNDIQEIGNVFDLHSLTLEDIANIQQRPKIEDMDDYIFLSLKMFEYDNATHELQEEQVSLVLGKHYLLSFQEKDGYDDFEMIKDRIKKSKWKIRKMGPDYLMYSLLDVIVDHYFVVLDKVQDDIELLQDELVNKPTKDTLPKIQQLKHYLIILRKSIWPLREMISFLQRYESSLIDGGLRMYLRDVYDHTIQIVDSIETFRDIISGSLDIYLSSISNRMNEVMKVLTIIGTIFIPLTFIVGVYGMNFKYMPELSLPWTYPTLWVIMLLIALGMVRYFKKKKWM